MRTNSTSSGVLYPHHSVLKQSNCSAVILKRLRQELATVRRSVPFRSAYNGYVYTGNAPMSVSSLELFIILEV